MTLIHSVDSKVVLSRDVYCASSQGCERSKMDLDLAFKSLKLGGKAEKQVGRGKCPTKQVQGNYNNPG